MSRSLRNNFIDNLFKINKYLIVFDPQDLFHYVVGTKDKNISENFFKYCFDILAWSLWSATSRGGNNVLMNIYSFDNSAVLSLLHNVSLSVLICILFQGRRNVYAIGGVGSHEAPPWLAPSGKIVEIPGHYPRLSVLYWSLYNNTCSFCIFIDREVCVIKVHTHGWRQLMAWSNLANLFCGSSHDFCQLYYNIKQIDFIFLCFCAVIDHRWRHSVWRTKSHGTRLRLVRISFFTRHDVICDLLQYRRTQKWNRFVN